MSIRMAFHLMSRKWIITLLLLCGVVPLINAAISVVGPRILRPHSAYRVAISSAGGRPTTLLLAVEGRRSTGENEVHNREVHIAPGVSRIVDFDIVDPGPGSYELTVRSTGGAPFSASAPLVYQNRSFCVFVQTDKRVYKPGDTVHFRVIALDKYMMPLSRVVDVTTIDSGSAPVRQWIQAPLDRGLLDAQFILADQPALGEWTIQVETHGQKYNSKILVADYVQPKFLINIDVPKHVLFGDGKFTANVTAKYWNGLPVQGELTLAAYPVFFSDVIQPVFSSPARKVVKMNGTASVEYSIKNDLNIAEDAARPIVLEAIIEEAKTGRRQNATTRTLLMRTPYRLHVHAPQYYKPELPYRVQLEVLDADGAPYKNGSTVATVQRMWDDGAPPNITTITLKNGLGIYTFIPDRIHKNMSTFYLKVKYMDIMQQVPIVRSSFTSGDQYLSLELGARDVRAGGELHAIVRATEQLDVLHYVVLGRGDVLLARTEEISPSRTTIDLRIPATVRMSPGAVLIAWYPRVTGEIVSSALRVPVAGMLQNDVQISIVPQQTRPDGSTELRLTSAPGSHAAMLGSDKLAISAGLASQDGLGNGLSLDMIEREIESFNGMSHAFTLHRDEVSDPGLGAAIGDMSTADTFMKAGVVILTDGIISSKNPSVPSSTKTPLIPVETGTRPPLAGPYAFSRLPPPPAPRFYLPTEVSATWLFSNVSIGPDGTSAINRHVPTTTGEWSVGGFAIHPTLGLGLATPTTFTAARLLSLDTVLPAAASVQQGEAVVIVAKFTSTLTADVTLEVTFHNSEQFFEFEPLDNDVETANKIELYRRQRLVVPAGGSAATVFVVSASRAGEAPVIIEGSGGGVSASFYKTLLVELPGEDEEIVSWDILDALRGPATSNISLAPPLGARLGSTVFSGAGDIMAPALYSLKKLPRLGADAEQALQPLIVGCVLLDYLQANGHDGAGVSAEARALLEAGNQRALAYRTPQGAFSIDLDSNEGDVWMTALAARWLSRAAKYVPISRTPGEEALSWLATQQQPDGSWAPPNQTPTTSASAAPIAPHAQRPIPLTAFALFALTESMGSNTIYKNNINKAVDFLARQVESTSEPYLLAVLAHALSVARHPDRVGALSSLEAHASFDAKNRWYGRRAPVSELRNPWLRSNSVDVETTSYALQALVAAHLHDDPATLAVARWLLNAGPQDFAPKVEALSNLATAMKFENKLRITANLIGSDENRQISLDDDNSLIIQSQLARNARNITVSTSGTGLGVAGLRAPMSSNVTSAWPRYTLDPRVDRTSTQHRLQLSICAGFVVVGNETMSGLTLLSVRLPSGFTADLDTVTALQSASHVRRAQLSRSGTEVLAWLSPLDNREHCATLVAARTAPVARQRPGWAKLQDSYDSSHRARVFFRATQSTLCSACGEFESCAKTCGSTERQQAAVDGDTDSSGQHLHATITLYFVLTIMLGYLCM